MNQAAIEIAKILLEFEIERQRKAVVADVPAKTTPAATALVAKSGKPTRRVNDTRLLAGVKTEGEK